MSMLDEIVKVSVKCHRNKHCTSINGCKNRNGTCECECHVVKRMNDELRLSELSGKVSWLPDFIGGTSS